MSGLELVAAVRRGDFRLEVDLLLGSGVTGITGPSGSGKSTLLHALAGLLPAEHLRLVLDGEVVVDTAGGIEPPAHRRAVGLVFQAREHGIPVLAASLLVAPVVARGWARLWAPGALVLGVQASSWVALGGGGPGASAAAPSPVVDAWRALDGNADAESRFLSEYAHLLDSYLEGFEPELAL